MSLKTWLKGLIKPESEETPSEKKKKKENHVQLSTLEDCFSAALATAELYPSNKTKINEFRWRAPDNTVRGYKVISFCDTKLDGTPAECHIFKIVKKI
jgi:hypothetical protein